MEKYKRLRIKQFGEIPSPEGGEADYDPGPYVEPTAKNAVWHRWLDYELSDKEETETASDGTGAESV